MLGEVHRGHRHDADHGRVAERERDEAGADSRRVVRGDRDVDLLGLCGGELGRELERIRPQADEVDHRRENLGDDREDERPAQWRQADVLAEPITEVDEIRAADGADRRGPHHQGDVATAGVRLGEVGRGEARLQVHRGADADEDDGDEQQRQRREDGCDDPEPRTAGGEQRAGRERGARGRAERPGPRAGSQRQRRRWSTSSRPCRSARESRPPG